MLARTATKLKEPKALAFDTLPNWKGGRRLIDTWRVDEISATNTRNGRMEKMSKFYESCTLCHESALVLLGGNYRKHDNGSGVQCLASGHNYRWATERRVMLSKIGTECVKIEKFGNGIIWVHLDCPGCFYFEFPIKYAYQYIVGKKYIPELLLKLEKEYYALQLEKIQKANQKEK